MLDSHPLGTGMAQGIDHAVAAEVALVRTGEVVAGAQAATVGAGLDLGGLIDGLVHPVPDAEAHDGGAVHREIDVLAHVAGAVAHGMGHLADEHGAVEGVAVAVHPVHAGVHLGIDVGEAVAAVTLAVARALVVDGAGGVEAVGQVVAVLEVAAAAGFVTQTPEDDGGMVAVAAHHAVDAVLEGGNPRRAVGDALVGMVLEVGFVHDVKAVVVEHGIHRGVVGIVGRAYGVDVSLLHELHIAQHTRGADGTAVDGVAVVAVDALEEDLAAVDIDLRTAYLDVAEAIGGGEGHLFAAVGIALDDVDLVEVGRFGAPEEQVVGHLEGDAEGIGGGAGLSIGFRTAGDAGVF